MAGQPSLSSRLLRHLQRGIARGYRPTTTWSTPVEFLLGGDGLPASRETVLGRVPSGGGLRIGMVVPTHVARLPLEGQEVVVARVVDRLEEACRAVADLTAVLFVGLQWQTPDEQRESRRRLGLLADHVAHRAGIQFVGLSLRGPGKVRTLNAAIALAEDLGLAGLGWTDDDVLLEPHCLEQLIAEFRARGCRGAVGATKVPHAKQHRTSRLLMWAKAVASPATSYPHGCCLLVALDVVAGGIPDRYACDDGYVCFRLLDPGRPDPMADLRLVPEARCHYYVAGPAGETGRRVRRLLLHHHVFLADWPLEVSRYYFTRILFHGLWPLTGWDGGDGVANGVQKAMISWLYFGWFASVSAELYLRGLVGRPLGQVAWAAYSSVETPASAPADIG